MDPKRKKLEEQCLNACKEAVVLCDLSNPRKPVMDFELWEYAYLLIQELDEYNDNDPRRWAIGEDGYKIPPYLTAEAIDILKSAMKKI